MSSSDNSKMLRLNHTELYQTCLQAGFKVHPRASREELAEVLEGKRSAPQLSEAEHPIDAWRLGFIAFMHDYWEVLAPQVKCPAKNLKHPEHPNPRPCFGCIDTTVVACLNKQASVEQHIAERKPKKP